MWPVCTLSDLPTLLSYKSRNLPSHRIAHTNFYLKVLETPNSTVSPIPNNLPFSQHLVDEQIHRILPPSMMFWNLLVPNRANEAYSAVSIHSEVSSSHLDLFILSSLNLARVHQLTSYPHHRNHIIYNNNHHNPTTSSKLITASHCIFRTQSHLFILSRVQLRRYHIGVTVNVGGSLVSLACAVSCSTLPLDVSLAIFSRRIDCLRVI